ncbi:hypothetical protein H0H87_008740 [Tephrocybe sp. NHM501043]|nr:hypothetical protein H0H87_008740 [Tephrocybe sp. NHM501043]
MEKHALVQEELRLVAALSAVRTKLNEFALISSLPSEVLEHIFSFCVSWLYDARRKDRSLAWTQVCRKWRCVSLDAARLWHTIDLCDARLASLCLHRSASAPIHLITTSAWKLPCAGDILSAHAPRIQSIDVSLFPNDLEDLFQSCGPELIGLQSLSIEVPPVSSNFVLDASTRLPSLRCLTLRGVWIPWTKCQGLTHLSLCRLTAGYSPTPAQLLAILEASPNIQDIYLDHISPTPSETEFVPVSPIPLLSLRQFSITAKARQIHAILSFIMLPESAALIIDCHQFTTLDSLFPTTLYHIPNILVHAIRFMGARACIFANSNPALSDLSAEPNIVLKAPCTAQAHAFLTHNPVLFTANVTTIEIADVMYNDEFMTAGALNTFLSHFPALELLRLTSFTDLSDIVTTLSTPVAQHGMPCQRLKSIWFGKAYVVALGWKGMEKEVRERLRSLVAVRREAGCPVRLVSAQDGELYAFCKDESSQGPD